MRLGWQVPCEHGPTDDCHVVHDAPAWHEIVPRDNVMPEGARGPVCMIDIHRHATTGEWCGGYVNFDVPESQAAASRPRWQLLNAELASLHMEPSLLCSPDKGGCGDHGFIRDGRWVSA